MASGQQERQLAAGLYLVLLGLPGSGAFKSFYPVMYSRALDTCMLVSRLRHGQENSKEERRRVGGRSQACQERDDDEEEG